MKITIKTLGLGLVGAFAFTSCDDQFLEDKQNFDNVSEGIYDFYSGCNGRVNDIYAWCLPGYGEMSWKVPAMGLNDAAGKSTEEYAGFSEFVNPEIEMSSSSSTNAVPDFFMGAQANVQEAVYGRIRNINDAIRGISNGSLSKEEKDELLGQVYFFRAWCYYNLMKWYGGVPLVTEVLDPVESSFTPRSSAKATYEFIMDDLKTAAEMLTKATTNGGWESSSDWGRVTTGTALALKGRVMLLWASPMFNRANDVNRWKDAYQEMKTDLPIIRSCGYDLFQQGRNNGADFSAMFLQSGKNPEAVFLTLYNNIVSDDGLDNQKNNRWERDIRPSNVGGQGKGASAMMVDLFPMADGKRPNVDAVDYKERYGYNYVNAYSKLDVSTEVYNAELPFLNRDPRFYYTFGFPGFRWAYNGDASAKDPNNPADGKNYTLWNYVWYTDLDDAGNAQSGNSFGADNLLSSKQGVYVRKKSDDMDVNSAPLYLYEPTYTKGTAPFFSAAPVIELRFAEVLLNYAEAACMAGEMTEAVDQLKAIRERVGYTGDCGLQANLSSDQAACMAAILYERQIEFAYEGKRFDDCRRWMLYDGGATQVPNAPATWTLTGWGGNTCTWLGFTPLNQQRRENMEFRTNDALGVGSTTFDSDPVLTNNIARPAGINFVTSTDLQADLANLAQFYTANLLRNDKKGDAYDSQQGYLYMNFRPNYYFLGFSHSATSNNKKLPQTIGWEDYNNGNADGTFDPLAETAAE